MKKKKVLILGKLPPPYMGPAIATEIILHSSLKESFELIHLDTRINSAISDIGKWSIRKVIKSITIYFSMLGILLFKRPQLVLIPISQTSTGFIKDSVFILFSKLCLSRCIIQLRGSNFKNWIESSSVLTRNYVKFILKIPKGVIVLGTNLKQLFSAYYTVEKIFVVPNGANYSIPKIEKEGKEKVEILYIGNLIRSKGVEDILHALVLLDKETRDKTSFTAMGSWMDEEMKKRCISIIEQNHLPVTILPSSESKNKFNYLAAADIFVFTPREPEGHPWVLVEALAAGLPIISTNQGAITESVIDGENGFIVKPKSPEEIAEKIKLLVADKEIRMRMAEKSRQLYVEKFTEEKMVQNLSQCFNAILSPLSI